MHAFDTRQHDVLADMRRELEATAPLYRTIVAGTDGSVTAQEAVRHAVAISRAHGARLHLVAAGASESEAELNRARSGVPADFHYAISPRSYLEAMLGDIADDIRASGIDVTCHAEVDVSPAEAILAVAQRTSADLIVVGNRGMTGVSRMLGSVPNTISHRAPCSVAIIRTS